MPYEKYSFNFTVNEVKEFLKQTTNRKKGITQQICWIIIFLGLTFLTFISGIISDILQGIFIGALIVYSLLLIFSYYKSKKILKDGRNRITNNTYQYEFSDNKILVTISDNISAKTVEIKYTDITNVKELKNHFVLEYANQNYFLRKADLIENAKITTL